MTPLVRPSQLLIFLVHWDCTFLMLKSGIMFTDKTKWNEGIRNLRTIHSLYSPQMGDVLVVIILRNGPEQNGTVLLLDLLAPGDKCKYGRLVCLFVAVPWAICAIVGVCCLSQRAFQRKRCTFMYRGECLPSNSMCKACSQKVESWSLKVAWAC